MWRPDNWEYQHATKCDIDKNPEKTWDVAHSYGWRDGYEVGADAMLQHLFSQEHQNWLATPEGEASDGRWTFIPEDK